MYKSKLFIILILFSIIVSGYNLFITKVKNISITNEIPSSLYENLLDGLNHKSNIIKDLN